MPLKKMECALCRKPIKDYHPRLNRLKIDESSHADICQGCIDKLMKWQQKIYADLFPTKAARKRFGKNI